LVKRAMCEVESPLSLSGLFIEEKKAQVNVDHIILYNSGFLSLPREVQVLILTHCPLSTLNTLVTVSVLFYQLIRNIVSHINQFNPQLLEEPTVDIQRAFQLMLKHSSHLKTLCGLCVENMWSGAAGCPEEIRFHISPEQLLDLIKRNPDLEHVVVYDFGVRDDTYLDRLLRAVSSCSRLRLIYSESAVGHASKVQEFVGQMLLLTEISFPNLPTLKSTMEPSGWFGYFPSSSGITHSRNGSSIQVLRKGKPELIHSFSSPAGIGNTFFDRVKLLPKTTPARVPSKGSSLRESTGPSVPRRVHIEVISE